MLGVGSEPVSDSNQNAQLGMSIKDEKFSPYRHKPQIHAILNQTTQLESKAKRPSLKHRAPKEEITIKTENLT